jgi:hypothetical protein
VKRATGQRHFLCRPLRGLDYSAIMDLGLTPQALCCTRFAGLAKSSSHLDAVSTRAVAGGSTSKYSVACSSSTHPLPQVVLTASRRNPDFSR